MMKVLSTKQRGVAYLAIFILIVSLTIIAAVTIYQDRTSIHTIEYRISFLSDTELRNITLVVPAPVKSNSSNIADIEFLSIPTYGVPDGWNLSGVEIQGSPMLRITADRFPPPLQTTTPPAGHNLSSPLTVKPIPLPTASVIQAGSGASRVVRISPGGVSHALPMQPVRFIIRDIVHRPLNTRNPLGEEPLLYPEGTVTHVSCRSLHATTAAECYSYSSRTYIEYSSVDPPDISVTISVRGTNNWWFLGWSSNWYEDRITFNPARGEAGWIIGNGEILAANGRYIHLP